VHAARETSRKALANADGARAAAAVKHAAIV